MGTSDEDAAGRNIAQDESIEVLREACRRLSAALHAEKAEHRRTQQARLALSRKLVHAQEDERRRLARDLHDHMGQQLTALRLQVETLRQRVHADVPALALIEHTQAIALQMEADMDVLARELRPTLLDDVGLRVALEDYVRRWGVRVGINTAFHSSWPEYERMPADVETNLYRIVQEALNNAAKHAYASRADVLLDRRGSDIVLVVEDDGVGFDPVAKEQSDRGLGLVGMRERAKLIGGSLEIESACGHGTTVFVRAPLVAPGRGETPK